MVRPHRGTNGKRYRGWTEKTIALARRKIGAMVRMAVREGIPLASLTGLGRLCQPDVAERVLEAYWRKDGDEPKIYTIDLAYFIVALADGMACVTPGDLERLKDLRERFEEHRPPKMTAKNMDVIRKVLGSDIWAEIIALPDLLMAEARGDLDRSPVKAAVTAQMAVVIRLLTVAPARMANHVSVCIGQHLTRPGGPSTFYRLTFSADEVKNDVPLEFPLTRETSALIDAYIHHFRPHLMRGLNHDFLYPGDGEPQKHIGTLSEQIIKRVWQKTGLTITPHQFRHAAAAIILREEPGNYEFVRRILGHRNIQTTMSFYVSLETAEATRQYGRLIEKRLKAQPNRTLRRPVPGMSPNRDKGRSK